MNMHSARPQPITPSVLLNKLSKLPLGGALSPAETLRWLRRFDAAVKQRTRAEKKFGIPMPRAVIFSPSMQCNYHCIGCYSRNHSTANELSTERIDAFFSELKQTGTPICLISGGEPFLRNDLPNLMQKHADLLFIVFTNGSQITEGLAQRLRKSGNIIPVLSIEGDEPTVTKRRGPDAATHIRQAVERFQNVDLLYGFSTMVTRETLPQVLDARFFSEKADRGFRLGFILEYVPVGRDVDRSQVLCSTERQQLRQAVLNARKQNPCLLFQLPDDAEDGVHCGAAQRFMHINSTGRLEPCPFAHHSDASIHDHSFLEALQSPFFHRIRQTPALFKKSELSCSLAENDALLNVIRSMSPHS